MDGGTVPAPLSSEWPDTGWVGVFPVLVEHAVAEHHWHEDGETRWLGGNNAGFDVVNRHGRTDAKTAWYGSGTQEGRLCFAAPRGGFDPARVDFIAPVVLDDPTLGYTALPEGGGQLTATYRDARIWVIPAVVVNRHLAYHAKGRSSVALDAIEPYRVSRGETRHL